MHMPHMAVHINSEILCVMCVYTLRAFKLWQYVLSLCITLLIFPNLLGQFMACSTLKD